MNIFHINKIKNTMGMFLNALLIVVIFVFGNGFANAAEGAGASSSEVDAKTSETITSILNMDIKYNGGDPELAHKYFSDIFGSFIYTPWGKGNASEITLISKAIGFTNILALFLGLVIIFYVLIGGALQTAHQGEVLGKSWSSIWLPIRTATGFGLIMPAAGIGGGVMSVAQMFIIWLIVMGSNSASVLWGKMADNISEGTPIAAPSYVPGITPVKNMLKMLACTDMYIKGKTIGKDKPRSDDVTVAVIYGKTTQRIITDFYDNEKGAYRLSSGQTFSSAINSQKASRIAFGDNGACGSIVFSEESKSEDKLLTEEYKAIAVDKAVEAARQVIGGTLDKLVPVATSLNSTEEGAIGINQSISEGETDKNKELFKLYTDAATKLSTISNSYSNDIVKNLHEKLSGDSDVASKFKESMKSGGWMKAGVWFNEMSSFSSLSIKTISKINSQIMPESPIVCLISIFDQEECDLKKYEMDNTLKLVDSLLGKIVGSSAASGDTNAVSIEDFSGSKCADPQSCTVDASIIQTASSRFSKTILNILASGNDPVGSTTGLENPFEVVTSVGNSILVFNEAMWVVGMTSWGVLNGVDALGRSTTLVSVATSGATAFIAGFAYGAGEWVIMSVAALLMSLTGIGFVLAYVIPFLPIITWITMIAGYLLTVVEATIAAPLAIILMVTPEGEGIAGSRLERAMQLLAMAILKPSFMVIGVIAAISLSYVCFSMMNLFFFQVAQTSLKGNIMDFVAIMVIYTTTAFQLCKLLISIMHKLPDQILDWFSSGVGRQFGEGDIGHQMDNSLQGMKQSASGIGQSIAGRIGERRRMNGNKKPTPAPTPTP